MKKYNDSYVDMLNNVQANLHQAHEEAWAIHWLMRGKRFLTNHPMIDDILDELNEQIDWIAERSIQVGGMPLTSFNQVLMETSIEDVPAVYNSDMQDSIRELLSIFEVLDTSYNSLHESAKSNNDVVTTSQVEQYLGYVEKQIWFLNAELGQSAYSSEGDGDTDEGGAIDG